jgi:hypothetical protein
MTRGDEIGGWMNEWMEPLFTYRLRKPTQPLYVYIDFIFLLDKNNTSTCTKKKNTSTLIYF